MRPQVWLGLVGFGAGLPASPLAAQVPYDESVLPLAALMRGPELTGRAPADVRWTPDGGAIWFRWLEPGAPWDAPLAWYRVAARPGAVPERMSEAAADSAGPARARGPLDSRRRARVVEWDGDLWLVPAAGAAAAAAAAGGGSGGIRALSRTPAAESAPHWSADGRRIFFERDGNAWSLGLDGGTLEQLTDIRSGPKPAPDTTSVDSVRTAQRNALRRAELDLFDAVRVQHERDSLARVERERVAARRPGVAWLGAKERVRALRVAPDGGAVLLLAATEHAAARSTSVPTWVTESGYAGRLDAREKVGDPDERLRVGLLDGRADSTIHWLTLVPGDTLPPYEVDLWGWQPGAGGGVALLRVVSADNTRRLLLAVRPDADSARITVLDDLRDPAWIGGPCSECGGWTPDGRRVWFVSEADGWAHLYDVAADGTGRRRLTSGSWEVRDAALSEDGREFLLHTSEPSPYEQQVFRMPAGGGARTRLTQATGAHEAVWSPDRRLLAVLYSAANQSPELYFQEARPGAVAVRLTRSPSPGFERVRWLTPEIVEIPASDGARVPARIYRPEDLGAQPNGAAVIFVHGAGYLQNAHRWWSYYSREYTFHHLLARRGYVVLDLDYRGSAGHGREWRTAVYRSMGGRDLQDHVDAARWLGTARAIPPERIGIYGGSYGGFITLMALFTEARWFGAGAALRAVTDWAHYNHEWTVRILDQPGEDTVAYRRSSPIFLAAGLEDPLLIAHGLQDTNVQAQDVIRLAQRLIELGKDRWELALYPVEDHAFERPDSWADEYRRILELFERWLR